MEPRRRWQSTIVREAEICARVRLVHHGRRAAAGDVARGDGHTVLVLPGLGGSDASTAPLRWFLGRPRVQDGRMGDWAGTLASGAT